MIWSSHQHLSFPTFCSSKEKVKRNLTSLYSECIKMSILRLKKSYEKESISRLSVYGDFLTASLIYCNFQFPNTKIQQFLLKSIRWQFQYTKEKNPNKLFTKLYSLRKNFVQKIYKSFVPSITFKWSGLKIFTTMNLSKYILTEPQTSRKFIRDDGEVRSRCLVQGTYSMCSFSVGSLQPRCSQKHSDLEKSHY